MAEEAFLEAIKKSPDNLEVYYAISNFYIEAAQPEKAKPYLEKMLVLIEKSDADAEIKAQRLQWVRESLEKIQAAE